jgi:hypothetical protein
MPQKVDTDYNMFTGPNIVKDGLVLYLDAANQKSYPGSGTTWNDLSGNGNNGTLVNGPTFDSVNNGSIVFDGVNDEITLPQSSVIKNLTTNFTISTFVKFNTSGGQYGIFTKGDNLTSGWTLYLRQGPQFAFIGYNTAGTSSGVIATPSGGVQQNIWYNVVYTYNGSSVLGYINAEPKASATLSSFTFRDTGNIPIIGKDTSLAAPGYWNGNIAQASIYNRALSAEEVLQNYNATKSRYGL